MDASKFASDLRHICSESIAQDRLQDAADLLTQGSAALARSPTSREEYGRAESIWEDLSSLWDTIDSQVDPGRSLLVIGTPLARLTRNLVAGVSSNQMNSLRFEPHIRRIVLRLSSWHYLQDSSYDSPLIMMTQALSNMVTSNPETQRAVWVPYMALPDEQNIILRLLESPKPKILTTTIVFILNCTKGAKDQTSLLLSSAAGIRVSKSLMDHANRLLDAPHDSEEGRLFDLCFEVSRNVFDLDLLQTAWDGLQSSEVALPPHRVILLKLLDSYLQLKSRPHNIDVSTAGSVTNAHFDVTSLARDAIQSALASAAASSSGATAVDADLATYVEGSILSTQCLIALLLGESEDAPSSGAMMLVKSATSNGAGVVECSLALLRLLDDFLPRILLGKAQSVPGSLSPASEARSDPTGFAYIKRDLVRLLGILCSGDRQVQDLIRERNGIQLVMNMCIVDERNPYLREHALFTLSNLLRNNIENQKVVDEFKPMVHWDNEGRLM